MTEPKHTQPGADNFEGPMPSEADLQEFRSALRAHAATPYDTAILRATSAGSLAVHLLLFATILSLPEQEYVRPASSVSLYPVQRIEVIVVPSKEQKPEPVKVVEQVPQKKPALALKPMKPVRVARVKTSKPQRKVVRKRRKSRPKVKQVLAKRTLPAKPAQAATPQPRQPTVVEAEVVSEDAVIDAHATIESSQGSSQGEERLAQATSDTTSGVDLNAMLAGYMRTVYSNVRRHKTYPRVAVRAGLEGRVELAIVIDTRGNIVSSKIHKSSGVELLDKAALKAISRLNKMPTPPTQLSWKKRTIYVPFVYKLS